MPEFRPVEVEYRGRTVRGEWYLQGGAIHVTSSLGRLSAPLRTPSHPVILPSETAKKLLWKVARKADPRRPFFYWR